MVLSVRLPVDMEKRFANLVAVSKRSKSSFVIEALRRTLDDMEREYLTPQALKRHQKYLTKATEVPPSQRLAYMLRLARESCNLTVEQAAERVGSPLNRYVAAENGEVFRNTQLKDWIKKLFEWDSGEM